jgi:arylsulfatase A-like enzyme
MMRLQPRLVALAVVALAVTATLVGCLGCGSRHDAEHSRIVQRLLPAGGEELSSSAVFYRQAEVFHWGFQKPEEVAAWRLERIGTEWQQRIDGLYMRAPGADPALVREVSLDASRVRAIRIEHSGLTSGGHVKLYWARQGEEFSEERALAADHPDPTGSLTPTFTFPVGHHHLWQGTITRLRLDPTSQPNRRVTLISVTGFDHISDPDALASVVARSWRVDLQGDVRSAVLTPPGHPHVVKVEVPRRASLRFSMGLEPEIGVPVRFRVHVIDDKGQTTPLWRGNLEPCRSSDGACTWLDQSVALDDYAGRTVTLQFDSLTEEPLDLFSGMPAWAGLEVVAPASTRRPPNVLMIVLDTLRADRLSLYGYHRQTTPHIDAWARQRGIVFANTVAPAPWTLPSHVSIFSGLDTITHSANTGDPVPPTILTLAEILRDQGYATTAVTGGGYLASEYHLMQGFDRVDYFFEPRLVPRESGNDIEHGMATALEWLESARDRPFFLLFHTYEVHGPYRAREPYFDRLRDAPFEGEPPLMTTSPIEPVMKDGFVFRSELVERILIDEGQRYDPLPPERLPLLQDIYDSSVARADVAVDRLLTRLTELGLDRETVVVLLSDHGEVLGEGGWGGHFGLQECELMVPLVFALPGGAHAGTTVRRQVRLVDVAPTVLDALGLPPLPVSDGVSLLPLARGEADGPPAEAWSYASSSNVGLSLRLDNRHKYTLNNSPWPPVRGVGTLYELGPGLAGEPEPTEDPARAAAMRRQVEERYQADSSGLRVRFANHESVPLACILKGPLVNPLRIKALDFPTDSIRWNLQRLEITIPPGRELTAFIEGNLHGELLVVAELDTVERPRKKTRNVLELDSLLEPWQVVLGSDGWDEDAAADLDRRTGVRVWVAGNPALVRMGGSVVGEDLRAQLEALGYVVH